MSLIDKGAEKLKKEQEHHCNTKIFGKLTKPKSITIKDENGDEFIVYEDRNGRIRLLPSRKR